MYHFFRSIFLFSLPLRPPLCTYDFMYWSAPIIWALITIFKLRHWYEHGYACLVHIYVWDYKYLIHFWEVIQIKRHHNSNEETPLLCNPLWSLHHCHHFSLDPMISIGHTMRSVPHTSGGNMLTPKIVHISLFGPNHNYTS